MENVNHPRLGDVGDICFDRDSSQRSLDNDILALFDPARLCIFWINVQFGIGLQFPQTRVIPVRECVYIGSRDPVLKMRGNFSAV